MEFKDWLEQKFLIWQSEIGKRRTLTAFAHYLGLSQPLVTQYLSGKVKSPSDESLRKIAEKLGPDIYDLLGLARPDPLIQELIVLAGKMSLPQIEKLLAYARAVSQESENA